MEIEHIRKELNQLLENVVDHSAAYSDERSIPSLEISFVMSKISKMQDRLSILRHLLEQNEKNSFQRKNIVPPIHSNATEITEPTPTKNQNKEEEEKLDIFQETPIITTSESEKNTPKIENFEQPSTTKLVDALTLNDRYLYANELFDKDMNSLNELVKSIDNCSSLSETKTLVESFNWDEENEHVSSFYILIERKFS